MHSVELRDMEFLVQLIMTMEILRGKIIAAGAMGADDAAALVVSDGATPDDLEAAERTLIAASDSDLGRFLKARDGDVDAALAMVQANVAWRAAVRPLMLRGSAVPAAGSLWWRFAGYSRTGMPVLSISTKHLNYAAFGGDMESYTRFVTYFTEVNVRRVVAGQTQAVILFDMAGYKPSMASPFGLRAVRALIAVLGDQYPERLGYGVVINAPGIFHVVFNAVKRHIDPATRKKVVFAKTPRTLSTLIPSSFLEECYGGTHAPYTAVPSGSVDEEVAAQRAALAAKIAAAGNGSDPAELPLDAVDALARFYADTDKTTEQIATIYEKHGGNAARIAKLFAALRAKYSAEKVGAAVGASNAALCAALSGSAGRAASGARSDADALAAITADATAEDAGDGAASAAVEAAFAE